MSAEVAAEVLHDGSELTLVAARVGAEIGQHSVGNLPRIVGILKIRVAHMCPKMGKSIGIRGSCRSFDALERSNLIHYEPLPSSGIAGAVFFVIS